MPYFALLGDNVTGKAICFAEICVPGANDAADKVPIFRYIEELDDLFWHCAQAIFPAICWQDQDERRLGEKGLFIGMEGQPCCIHAQLHDEAVRVVGG